MTSDWPGRILQECSPTVMVPIGCRPRTRDACTCGPPAIMFTAASMRWTKTTHPALPLPESHTITCTLPMMPGRSDNS